MSWYTHARKGRIHFIVLLVLSFLLGGAGLLFAQSPTGAEPSGEPTPPVAQEQAQAPNTEAAPKPPTGASETPADLAEPEEGTTITLSVHADSNPEHRALALGMQFALEEAILQAGKVDVVSLDKVETEGKKTDSFLEATGQLTTKNLPMLGLTLKTDQVVVVRLGVDETGKPAALVRNFNPATKLPRKTLQVSFEENSWPDFTRKLFEAVQQSLGFKLAEAPLDFHSVSRVGLDTWGKLWLAKDQTKEAGNLVKRLIYAEDIKPNIAERYFKKSLPKALKSEGKRAAYLKKRFLGDPKAIHALSVQQAKVFKKPNENIEALATLLYLENQPGKACHQPEEKKAKKLLAEIRKAIGKLDKPDPQVQYRLGFCLQSQGLDAEALAAWEKSLPLDQPDLATLRLLAEKASLDTVKESAEKQLLQAYEEQFMEDEAEALRIKRFLAKPSEATVSVLHPERWTEEQRLAVLETSKSVQEPDAKAMMGLTTLLTAASKQEKINTDWLDRQLAPMESSLNDNALSFLLGRFLVERVPDIDRIEKYLLVPSKQDNEVGLRALEWLARGYFETGTYDKAVEAYEKLFRQITPDEGQREHLVDALIGAKRLDDALKTLDELIQQKPDCSRLLMKKADLLQQMEKESEAQALRKQALSLNQILAANAKAEEEAQKIENEKKAKLAKEEKAKKPVAVKKDLSKLSLTWEELKSPMGKLPPLAGKVGLVLPDQFSKPLLESLPSYVMEPFVFDTERLVRDIEKLVRYQYDVVLLQDLSFSDSGLGRFPGGTIQQQIQSKKLVGVLVAQIHQSGSSGLSVGMSLVLPKEPKPLFFTTGITSHLTDLVTFNLAILILPLLVIALLVLQSIKKRKAGVGSVALSVIRDEQDVGYYGARVSSKPLKQAFRVDTILEKAGVGGDKVDVASMIKRQFNPWWTHDRKSILDNAARFDKLPVGEWYLYIGGLTVDYRTGKAVGTFEMERRFVVKRDQETVLSVDLTTTEVYLEVKVFVEEIRETAAKKKADEKKKKEKGKDKDKKADKKNDKKKEADEKPQKQFIKEVKVINGAKVQLNKNPDQTLVTEQGRGASFYVEPNRYLITATYEGMAAYQIVEFLDPAPQFVELYLKPATEVEFPAVPEPLKTLAEQAIKDPSTQEIPVPVNPQEKVANFTSASPVPTTPNYLKTPPPELKMNEEEIGLDLDQSTYVGDTPAEAAQAAPATPPPPGVQAPVQAAPVAAAEEVTGESLGGTLDALFDTSLEQDRPRSEYSADPKIHAHELEKHGKFKEAGELYIELGDFEKAIDCCQRADDPDLNYKLYGLNYLKEGHYQEALEMFKQIGDMLLQAASLEGLRMFEEANLLRADYYQQQGQSVEAAEAFEKAGKYAKAADLYLKLENPQKAANSYFKAREYEKAAELYYRLKNPERLAISYEMAGKYMLAAAVYRELDQQEKVCEMWLSAGHLLHAADGFKRLGQADKAKEICENIEVDHPQFLDTQVILAQILREEGHDEFASDLVREIIEDADVDRENLAVYLKFAAGVQKNGMRSDAMFILRKLQIVSPDNPDIAERLAILASRAHEPDDPPPQPVAPADAPKPQPQPEPTFAPAPEMASAPAQPVAEPASMEEPPPVPSAEEPPPAPGEEGNEMARTKPQIPRLDSDDDIRLPGPSEPKLIGPDGRKRSTSGRYVFEGEIGRGAMGIVFKAKDTVLGRSVAYKTVSNAIKDNPAALKYFLSEAKSLAALNHQNIVTIFDVGQEDGNYFLTMEFVEGQSLSALIKKKRRLSIRNTVIIFSKICQGLEYAHQQNVIHRDIKPSNIMISNKGEVKIMDFGLAKIVNKAMQDRTLVRGTPLYMSPEQVHGDGIGRRSDIYSLGITVFEMATGTLPFTKGDIGYHHMNTAPPRPSQFNKSLPEGLENIILTCLAKSKDDRYPSVTELRKALVPLRQSLVK